MKCHLAFGAILGCLFLTGVAPPFFELFNSSVNCGTRIVMQVILAYRNADKCVWWNRMDHRCGSSPAFLTDCKVLEFPLESVFHLFLPFLINEINCLQMFISYFFTSRFFFLKNDDPGASRAIQLGLSIFPAVPPGSIPGQGTDKLQAIQRSPSPAPQKWYLETVCYAGTCNKSLLYVTHI